jgi:hypothetical protein
MRERTTRGRDWVAAERVAVMRLGSRQYTPRNSHVSGQPRPLAAARRRKASRSLRVKVHGRWLEARA